MPTFGNTDIIQDQNGNALPNVTIIVYGSQANATAQTNPLGSAQTNSKGQWPLTVNGVDQVWARDPSGNVWVVASDTVAGDHAARLTALETGTVFAPSTGSSTYETQTHASSTYETQSHAAATYAPATGSATYETQSHASSTYQTQSGLDAATGTNVNTAGSSTDVALKAIYGRKTLEPVRSLDYCKGDGVTDDTAALQSALNAAVNSGRTLEIKGRNLITSPLVLPVGVPISIRGASIDVNPFGALSADVASIESSGASVFTPASSSSVILELQGVNFRNTNGGITTSLFNAVNFSQSRIVANTAGNYNYIFNGGSIGGVTRITGNRFLTIKSVFCSANLIDSVISENYIDGNKATNSTVFTGQWASSLFSGNYVDFFKRVFDLPTGAMDDVRVIGNIFDYVWCTIGTSTGAYLTSFTVVGNTWHHCTAALANVQFTAPDADMTGTPYRALDASAGINRTTITGNHFIEVSLAIRLVGTVNNLVESGNVYDDTTLTNRVAYGSGGSVGVVLEALGYARSTPTFAAAQNVDFASAAMAEITLTANMTSLTPLNGNGDQVYEIQLVQDATGSRTLAGASAKFKWAGAVAPTLSTGAGRRDVFRFRYNSATDTYVEISRAMNVG